MIVNAQQLTSSRFCVAQFCAFDAEPGSEWCQQHIKLTSIGVEVTRHAITQPSVPDPATHLWCTGCEAWHPDANFNKKHDAGPTRRGRRGECSECDTRRRKAYNATLDAETARNRRLRANERKRARGAARRARINGHPA